MLSGRLKQRGNGGWNLKHGFIYWFSRSRNVLKIPTNVRFMFSPILKIKVLSFPQQSMMSFIQPTTSLDIVSVFFTWKSPRRRSSGPISPSKRENTPSASPVRNTTEHSRQNTVKTLSFTKQKCPFIVTPSKLFKSKPVSDKRLVKSSAKTIGNRHSFEKRSKRLRWRTGMLVSMNDR